MAGGGAGAGIGGNGGAGGQANAKFGTNRPCQVGTESDSGYDGKSGETAGIINIYNNLIVYAYGGGGGSGGMSPLPNNYTNSGGGAGGYPAAGIGGGGAGGGGGDHCKAAGGYSGGAGEPYNLGNVNGLASIFTEANRDSLESLGGGYYTYSIVPSEKKILEPWFGLGGAYSNMILWSMGGSGGTAGEGGTIKCSENAKIYAYNGDRITNGDYTTTYYQYDKDGNLTGTQANIVIKPNNKKIIPAVIFIQSGIRRAVYNYSCYMSNELLTKYAINRDTTQVKLVKIINEDITVSHFSQGIGSGAGYIELSNGTYTVDANMN